LPDHKKVIKHVRISCATEHIQPAIVDMDDNPAKPEALPEDHENMVQALEKVINALEILDNKALQKKQAYGKELAKRVLDNVVSIPRANEEGGNHLLIDAKYKNQEISGLLDTGTRHCIMSLASYQTLSDPPILKTTNYVFSVADGNQSRACGQILLKFRIGDKKTKQTVFITPGTEPLFLIGMLCLNSMGLTSIELHPDSPQRLVFKDGTIVPLRRQDRKGNYYLRLSQGTNIPPRGEVLMPVYLDPGSFDSNLKMAMCHTNEELWDKYPVQVNTGLTQVKDGFGKINLRNTSLESVYLPGGTLVSTCTNDNESEIIKVDKKNKLDDDIKEEYFDFIKENLACRVEVENTPEGKHKSREDEEEILCNSEDYMREICSDIPSGQEQQKRTKEEEEQMEEQFQQETDEELKEMTRVRSVATQTDGVQRMEVNIKQNEFDDESIRAPHSLANYVSKHMHISEKSEMERALRKIPDEAYKNIGDDPVDDSSEDETTLPHMRKKLKEEGFEDMFMPKKVKGQMEQRTEGKLHKHMEDMYLRHLPYIPKDRQKDLYRVLLKTQDSYRDPYRPQTVSEKVEEHAIDTEENKPFKLRPRRMPSAMTEVVDKEIQDMLDNGVISPSESPWASAIVLVKKKDGSIRFCIDYRVLNVKTKKDSYPLPRIDNCLEALEGAKYFCSLDLASGYWQIKVHEKDKEKTAFSSPRGHFEFNVMPFGLCNAPATFQRIMDRILLDLIDAGVCVAYLDDIIIVGKDLDDIFHNYMKVVRRFSKYNLKLKPSKCNLFRKSVNFLGHIISDKGIGTDPAKIKKVEAWPEPKRLGHVRSFLGLACYYQRFIPDYGTIAEPLQKLTKKDIKFVWSDEQQKSFDTLKHLLTTAPILGYPMDGEMFIIDTDASNVAVGAVLSQVQNDVEKVIAYGTKTLSESQQNYCTTKRELFAVFHFVTVKFRNYVLGRKFLLRTDHCSLTWLMNFKQHDQLLNRWVMALATYSNRWILQHRAGKSHGNADGMSRISTKFCRRAACPHCLNYRDKDKPIVPKQAEIDDMVDYCRQPESYWKKVNQITKNVPLAAMAQDVELADSESESDKDSEESEEEEENYMHLLYKREQTGSEGSDSDEDQRVQRVLVTTDRGNKVPAEIDEDEPLVPQVKPRDLAILQDQDIDICRLKILMSLYGEEKPPNKKLKQESRRIKNFVMFWHDLAYHEGVLYKKGWDNEYRLVTPFSLQELLLKQVHGNSGIMGHPGETKAKLILCKHFYWPGMRKDITSWVHCCVPCRLAKRGKVNKAVLEKSFTGERNHRIGIDIIGPLPETKDGNRFILTICDYFTKWVECVPLVRHTGRNVCNALFNRWVVPMGVPGWVHSDQGSDFESEVMTQLCQLLKISKTRTNPYRPRSAGLVERHNGTIKRMLETVVDGQRDEWDLHLPMVMMAYRATPHSSTGFSPNMMMFGTENNSTLDLIFPPGPVVKDMRNGIECYCQYISFLRRSLIRTHEVAREKLHAASEHMQFHHDKSAHVLRDFNKGDWVLYFHKPTAQKSLASGWTGPYVVVKRVNDYTFTIMRNEFSGPTNVHGDYLYLDANHRRPCPWLDTLTEEELSPKGRRARFSERDKRSSKDNEWMDLEKFQGLENRRAINVPEAEINDHGTQTIELAEPDEDGPQIEDMPGKYNLRSRKKNSEFGTRTMNLEVTDNNSGDDTNEHNKIIEAAIEGEKRQRRKNLDKKDTFTDLNQFSDIRTSMRIKSKPRIDYKRLHDGEESSDDA
jgi:hypothetical protein